MLCRIHNCVGGNVRVLTNDEVIWGYRYILGRDPESIDVVTAKAEATTNIQAFRTSLLQSDEFQRLSSQFQKSRRIIAPVFKDTRLMWIDLKDRFVSLGCLEGNYEPAESKFLRDILKPDDIFVDVGANVGWFTLLASTILGSRALIHAFEPRRPIVDDLQRTVTLNGLNNMITVYPFGLSNNNKSEVLMWPADTDNGGMASLARGVIDPGMTQQTIEVRTLDSLSLGHIDIVKIDVEGAEPLVVEGGQKTIERARPTVLTEIFPQQLERVCARGPQDYFNFFLSRQYTGYIVDQVRFGEKVDEFPKNWARELVNIAFVPKEKATQHLVFNNASRTKRARGRY